MADLHKYYRIIEDALKTIGLPPEEAKGEQDGQWNVKRGSASVWIDIYEIDEEKGAYFQVITPIMTVPKEVAKQNELFEELLHLNYRLFGIAFTVHQGGVYLKAIREVEGLIETEAIHMIGRAGNYGDFYNDRLIKKYGGRKIE